MITTVAVLVAFILAGRAGVPEDGDVFARIDAFMQAELDGSKIPGAAVAIVEGGQAVHVRGFGEDGHGGAVTEDTPFWIGSNGKSFTALAVMQLVEEGRIQLDEPVVTYVPGFHTADAESSARITVRHLLNQTSGFSRSDGLRPLLDARQQSIADEVEGMQSLRLNRPVGERYEYSNLNFVLLGHLVEVVTGQTWGEYVQANILAPLSMERSFTDIDEARAAGLTATHRMVFGFALDSTPTYLPSLAPTGFIFSTANDMARYLSMYVLGGELDGVRVLSEEGIETMLSPATNEASVQLQSQRFEFRYGEGWFVGPFGPAADARWHQGSLPEFAAWMVLLPDTDQAVMVLLNAGHQFEIAGANSVFSRIPVGVVSLLRGEDAPNGLTTTQFYVLFNSVVVTVLGVQVWSLLRMTRENRMAGRSMALAVAPLAWEFGLAVLVLAFFPFLLTGGGWAATFRFLPDLSLVVVAIALLWLVTGSVRVWQLTRGRRGQTRGAGRAGAGYASGTRRDVRSASGANERR